ncbi:unnamed protein product [Didymodactylos carnosus]|uniref:MYND-type domain-containing protein n=1 Tax=Didymodactylos carnosus TaxID=1234261 RepID=A0A813XZJ2_9BILA|nr:unnamed protein product [Didymodactylos carnosus]CAF0970181.1 unnamed protein product [Didymodactylos carnosus]CAF3661451.1 unnamed protein product [Didymodactylos carnosus]CAF3741622.1 unnamed protein product [Didymodactylos carnosus]
MQCLASNKSTLTALAGNTLFGNESVLTNDIEGIDIVQFADGWFSYPELNLFDSDVLIDALTLRNVKDKLSPWSPTIDNRLSVPITDTASRQLEALFNLSQLLFGLSRAELSNYTFRDLQLGHSPKAFRQTGFKKFSKDDVIDFYQCFQDVVYDAVEAGAVDIVFLMYKDPRLRLVKQKCLDFLSNITTPCDIARSLLQEQTWFLDQLMIGIRDGQLIEEKIPSLSVIIRLCKIIVEQNLIQYYSHLIDMQYIDILIDLFENLEYKTSAYLPYFIKMESLCLQCLTILFQCPEHVDMWSERAQIRLVNYCCTIMHKAALGGQQHQQHNQDINHILYAEQKSTTHSLGYSILTFLHIVRCKKDIMTFYKENMHFRELLIALRHKYGPNTLYKIKDPSIYYALSHVICVMFDYKTKRHKKQHRQQQQLLGETDDDMNNNKFRKCSNPMCQRIENEHNVFYQCQSCQRMAYCSHYCRDVHWTLKHSKSCQNIISEHKQDDVVLELETEYINPHNTTPASTSEDSPIDCTVFDTVPIQTTQSVIVVEGKDEEEEPEYKTCVSTRRPLKTSTTTDLTSVIDKNEQSSQLRVEEDFEHMKRFVANTLEDNTTELEEKEEIVPVKERSIQLHSLNYTANTCSTRNHEHLSSDSDDSSSGSGDEDEILNHADAQPVNCFEQQYQQYHVKAILHRPSTQRTLRFPLTRIDHSKPLQQQQQQQQQRPSTHQNRRSSTTTKRYISTPKRTTKHQRPNHYHHHSSGGSTRTHHDSDSRSSSNSQNKKQKYTVNNRLYQQIHQSQQLRPPVPPLHHHHSRRKIHHDNINLSQLSALNNASVTSQFVNITQADIPKAIEEKINKNKHQTGKKKHKKCVIS